MRDGLVQHFDMPLASREAGAPRTHAPAAPAPERRRMHTRARAFALPCSPLTLTLVVTVTLGIVYIGLIATVMSYGTLTVNFAQSVRDDEATVAALEARYLAAVSDVTAVDYAAQGYEKPLAERFVPAARQTAVR